MRAFTTPETQGSVRQAIVELFDHNPGRRPILMHIVKMCGKEGASASAVAASVDELQKDNRSVYAPMTLCRMLERAGALTLEMPETHEEVEDIEEGVEYLEIKERIDPIGMRRRKALLSAKSFRKVRCSATSCSTEIRSTWDVYRAVMEALAEKASFERRGGRTGRHVRHRQKRPRRFGGHFIDILERADAIEWKNRAWTITDLGRELLPLTASAGEE